MARVRVKICGITNLTDARRAIESGAEFLGFNFFAGSPRYITPATARQIVKRLPENVSAVGVFVNESEQRMLAIARAVGLSYLQLHGDELPAAVGRLERRISVIKAIRVRKPFRMACLKQFKQATAILLDGFDAGQRGGSGKTFEWAIARRAALHSRIFLAGGLTPQNVAEAIRVAKPYAVDVCSGVESAPRRKDPKRMRNLISAINKTTAKSRIPKAPR
jgi:phosphoribosylanthranilate isomerase